MDQFLSIGCDQRARHLPSDPESQVSRPRTPPLDTSLNGLALDILHCIVELPFGITEVKDRSDVRVAQTGSGSSFPQKALAGCFAIQKLRIDHLECDIRPQIRVKRFVGDPHGAPTEFPQGTIGVSHYDEMFKLICLVHTPESTRPHDHLIY